MDKQQAKFILQSFRPDGADAADEDFAQALQFAAQDRELGDWLAQERATDAAFATALTEVAIPESLRLHILAVMHGETLTDPTEDQELDDLLSDALSQVQPPEDLRSNILTAMENSLPKHQADNIQSIPQKPKARSFSNWKQWAAVAAAIVLGAFLALRFTGDNDDRLASHSVHLEAARILADSPQLNLVDGNTQNINSWLTDHNLPTPTLLPKGLQGMKHLGCKMIVLPGDTKASLVCFKEDSGGMIHLVIVPNDQLKPENLPSIKDVKAGDCYHCPNSRWNVARWRDAKNTFILLAGKDQPDKKAVLQYF